MNIILKFNTILLKNIQIDNQVIFFFACKIKSFLKNKNKYRIYDVERERGRGSKSEDF